MKKIAACILLICSQVVVAQGTDELQVTLPEWEFVLPPASPALFEREGVLLLTERTFWERLSPLVRDSLYEESLALFRTEDFAVVEDMENGVLRGPLTHGNDTSAALLFMLGHIYRMLEQHEPAETAFLSALRYLPDYVRVHESLGLLYVTLERYPEAIEHLTRAVELGLNTASVHGSLGFLNQATNNPWGAVAAYQQASMLDPDNEPWLRGLLYALNESRNYGSAFALVEQLLEEHPNDTDLWVFRAHLARQTDDQIAALASLETAIRLGNDTVSNLQICATLHMQLGSVTRAIELLELGFVAGLDYIYIDQALAWLITEEEWDYAGQLLDGAEPGFNDLDDSDRSRVLTYSAAIAANDGETDEAETQLIEALDLDASNGNALMELAALYQDNDNYGQAELFYQRASAFDVYREPATMSLAQLAIDQNRYDRALELLRDIVQRNPQRIDVRRNIEILEDLVQLRGGI